MAPPEHGKSPNRAHAVDKRYVHLVKGSKVEATSKAEGYVDSWFAGTVIKPPEMPNSKFPAKRLTIVEYADLLNEDSSLLLREPVDAKMLRPVPPRVEENGGFEVGDVVDAFHLDGWWTGKVGQVVREGGEGEPRYVVKFAVPEHEIEFGKDLLRLHLDWNDGKWFHYRNGKAQELVIQEDGRATLPINDGCNKPKERVIHNPAPTPSDEDSTHLAAKASPPLSSSWHQRTMDAKRPAKKQKKTAEGPLVNASGKTAELTGPLRKGDHHNNESGNPITSASPEKNDSIIRTKRTKRRAGRNKGVQDASTDDDVSKEDDVHNDLSLEQQLQMVVRSESTLAKQGEPQGTNSINDPHMQELALVAVGTELNPKEQGHEKNENTSPVFEGTMVVLNKQQQTATNDISVMGPSLPFQRSVPIWDTVESLEIFRKFPQQPHFLPLMDSKERFREGLAIAKMVTFASTAESAINLSIDDDMGAFIDCLEALETLESYGFEAETLKRRLKKIIWLKEMQRKVDEEKNEQKGKVSELKHDIVEVKKEIHKAASKIKFYQDKLKLALLKEEEKSIEVLALETSLDVLDTTIQHARSEFEVSRGGS